MRKATALALSVLLSGCYTTRSGGAAASTGNERTERQWFTGAGLVPLSDPVGGECADGLAYSEATTSPLDAVLTAGVFLAGALFGGIVCSQLGNSGAQGPCAFFALVAPPLLIGSRTVTYACAAGPRSAPAPVLPTAPLPPSDVVGPPPPPLP